MIDSLLQPAMVPFTVALGIMLAIALIEVVSLLFGAGLSQAVDSLLPDFDVPDVNLPDVEAPDIDLDAGGAGAPESLGSAGALATVLAWFCLGRVPAVIVLIAFLTAFGLVGVAVQSVAGNVGGAPLPLLVAVAATLVVALPLTRYLALAFAWIMPQEETEAVDSDAFVGQVAEIIRGTALPGSRQKRSSPTRMEPFTTSWWSRFRKQRPWKRGRRPCCSSARVRSSSPSWRRRPPSKAN